MMQSTPHSSSHKMQSSELRATLSLAAVFALRMLGLFLVLPIFMLYAKTLTDGSNETLVGLAFGAYGLIQAMLQIPFGMASDQWGRKPIIVFGLILFAIGALIAAQATSVTGLLVGRAIQGSGAISAAITALLADTTRESQRTKAMAIIGASIGVSFSLSLIFATILYSKIGMQGIFYLIAALSLAAIVMLLLVTPSAPKVLTEKVPFSAVLKQPDLLRLNVGVFVLHLSQMAMFVIVPSALVDYAHLNVPDHWKIYLPVIIGSFFVMMFFIGKAERSQRMKTLFLFAISILFIVQLGLGLLWQNLWALVALLFAFFFAFNILEASQPSLVSRLAPPGAKGAALGVYNTLQALGLGLGGYLGAIIKQHWGVQAVFFTVACFSLIWLIIARHMPEIQSKRNHT